jgi:hypothetical protein
MTKIIAGIERRVLNDEMMIFWCFMRSTRSCCCS